MTCAMVDGLEVNDKIINQPKYELLFTVEEVNKLVLNGILWTVGAQVPAGGVSSDVQEEPKYPTIDEAIARGNIAIWDKSP